MEIVVGGAIAVVVEAITACLHPRLEGLGVGAAPHPLQAGQGGAATHSLGQAHLVGGGIHGALVHLARAVVVESVTPLRGAFVAGGIVVGTVEAQAAVALAEAVAVLVDTGQALARGGQALGGGLAVALDLGAGVAGGAGLLGGAQLGAVGARPHLHTQILVVVTLQVGLAGATQVAAVGHTVKAVVDRLVLDELALPPRGAVTAALGTDAATSRAGQAVARGALRALAAQITKLPQPPHVGGQEGVGQGEVEAHIQRGVVGQGADAAGVVTGGGEEQGTQAPGKAAQGRPP